MDIISYNNAQEVAYWSHVMMVLYDHTTNHYIRFTSRFIRFLGYTGMYIYIAVL